MKWRITNIVLAIAVLGLSGTGLAQAAPETKYIRDDATGVIALLLECGIFPPKHVH